MAPDRPASPDLAGSLQATLEGRRDAYLQDLAGLVALDSPTSDKGSVDRVGQVVASRLDAMGCHVEMMPSATYGNTLLGAMRGDGRARILLIGHLDTVHPLGTTLARPFTVRDGRAYGPGTADMKAGVLAGIYALEALSALDWRPFAELSLLLNSDEEVGSPSSSAFIATQASHAHAVLVLEAARGNGAVVVARKGTGTYHVSVRGRAAHTGAHPEQGRNAIVELCHKLLMLDKLNGLQPGVTVNVGAVQGGTVSNVVPAEAVAEIDVRVPNDAAALAVDRAIHELMATAVIDGTVTTVTGGMIHPPMPRRPGTEYLLALARRGAAELGFTVPAAESGGASDANQPSAMGIPTLDGLGPIGVGAHSVDEHIVIDSIVPRTALLARLIALCDEEPFPTDDKIHKQE